MYPFKCPPRSRGVSGHKNVHRTIAVFVHSQQHSTSLPALFGCNVACAFFHVWLMANWLQKTKSTLHSGSVIVINPRYTLNIKSLITLIVKYFFGITAVLQFNCVLQMRSIGRRPPVLSFYTSQLKLSVIWHSMIQIYTVTIRPDAECLGWTEGHTKIRGLLGEGRAKPSSDRNMWRIQLGAIQINDCFKSVERTFIEDEVNIRPLFPWLLVPIIGLNTLFRVRARVMHALSIWTNISNEIL